MNKKIVLLISLLILNLLTSCTDNVDQSENEVLNSNETSKKIKQEINIEKDLLKWNNDVVKELTIDNKCIWCWKCIIVAPDNFTMDYDTFTAIVTSQKNILSNEVSKAIQVCPVDSIKVI